MVVVVVVVVVCVVVVSGTVVVVVAGIVVVVEVVVVVAGTAFVVNAESGTISKPALSMFQANMMQVLPPFSYIHSSSG